MTGLTIVSLNTRGLPLFGSALRTRYTAIAEAFEKSLVDVVNLQEVLTYRHLHLLRRSMPSYRTNFRPSAAGPAGGLVTFTRHPAVGTRYRRFPAAPTTAGLRRRARLDARLKGVLFTRLPGLTVLNTHLLANHDGDWSTANRYYPIHHAQLTALTQYAGSVEGPMVLAGDFNIARDTDLYRDFLRSSGLVDAFGDDCPPTFHQAYLRPGQPAHCIDFILLSNLTAESAHTDANYPSDHLGLEIRAK
ncbi:MAG TPA: endonuclease/exonuclease/phosphatase family protein [Kribbella sp.]